MDKTSRVTLNLRFPRGNLQTGNILLTQRRAGGIVGTMLEGCIGTCRSLTQGADVQEGSGNK